MTRKGVIPLDVVKEIHALLPTWLVCMVIVSAARVPDGRGFLVRAGILTYFIGCAALGGLAVGHEYANRTVPLMLSAPTSRRRAFAIKAGVFVPMLLIFAATAFATLGVGVAEAHMDDTAILSLAALLGSLFLAPWMTMVCRNPLAGAVFGVSIPSLVLIASELLPLFVYGVAGINGPAADRLRTWTLIGGLSTLSVFGAGMTWRAFMRLEDLVGGDHHLHLPDWLAAREPSHVSPGAASRPRPVRALIRKELRLQQLTIMVTGLYLCGWLAVLLLQRLGDRVFDALVVMTVVHGAVVALLAGSLASAEERHFGTLEAQVLMPMSMARQWTVKIAVVFTTVIALAVLLPLLLGALMLKLVPTADDMRPSLVFVGLLMLATAISMYVSSFSRSGLRALLSSLPVVMAALVLFELSGFAAFWVLSAILRVGNPDTLAIAHSGRLVAIVGTVLTALLLRFALVNHRSSDRGVLRMWRQCAMIIASVAVYVGVAVLMAVTGWP